MEWLQNLTPPATVTGATLAAYVLLDVFLIVAMARVLGTLLQKVGQPRVVGEILAGVLLGPTLLGANLSQVISPLQARPIIANFATMALIMFMFLAGVEYDMSKIKGRGKQALVFGLLAVAIPALLGFPVASLMHTPEYAGPAGAALLPFALFIGAALAVTAFPVMAHILMERGELNSPLGGLAVATTGIMSVMMFSYIAFAGAVAASNGFASFMTKMTYVVMFMLAAWYVVRPLLPRLLPDDPEGAAVTGNGMALIFSGMVLFGLIGHVIGIHAMVGAFAWGLILPTTGRLRETVANKMRDVAMIFFLPIFFAVAGFSTDLKLVGLDNLGVVFLMLAAAIGGKFLAAAPARFFGLGWREAGVLGALFNTRGLLVLVAGLIGLDMQIITILTFTIIVIVALVTNLMTLPLLNLFSPPAPERGGPVREAAVLVGQR